MKALEGVYLWSCYQAWKSRINTECRPKSQVKASLAIDRCSRLLLMSQSDMARTTLLKSGSLIYSVWMPLWTLILSILASHTPANVSFTLSIETLYSLIMLRVRICWTNFRLFLWPHITKTLQTTCNCCQMRQLTKSLFLWDLLMKLKLLEKCQTFFAPFKSHLKEKSAKSLCQRLELAQSVRSVVFYLTLITIYIIKCSQRFYPCP